MKAMLERERKWDVDEGFVLPRLDDIVPGLEVERSSVKLTSVYFDTRDRDLQSHGVLLRRRTGDDDTGWQLKIPNINGRTEIHAGPPDDDIPADVSRLLTGLALGKKLIDIATIHTVRDRYRILTPATGELCAEVADDHVRASAAGERTGWREIEVELGSGAESIPDELVSRLAEAGARPADVPSKLARVSPRPPVNHTGRAPAQHVVTKYLCAQIDAIFDGDLALRQGRDPIHDTRVAIRRLRSTLRVFAKRLAWQVFGDIDDELKWFAGLLGEVRDSQVQQRRFRDAIEQLPVDLVLGPVASRIHSELRSTELRARSEVTDAMDSARYLNILARLQHWRSSPPLGHGVTAKALKKSVRRAGSKADRRLDAAIAADDAGALHRARKAAKRARYAAELLRPITKGRNTKAAIRYHKRVQSVLGDHQDGVVAADFLRRAALTAGTTAGENGFTFGLLYANEIHAAERMRRAVRRLR